MSGNGQSALVRRLEENANAAARRGRTVVQVGPFEALLNPNSAAIWRNYAVPVGPLDDRHAVHGAFIELAETFRTQDRTLRFEFMESLYPDLPAILEAAGLDLQERQPLMYCEPDTLRQPLGRDVRLQQVDAADSDLIRTSLELRTTVFEGPASSPPSETELADFSARLKDGASRCVVGWLGDTLAGAGDAIPLDDIAEIVGVATLPAYRRRGVAATVSAALARDHFEQSGSTVWLSAADETARAVYASIGFQLIDARLNYIARTQDHFGTEERETAE